VQRWRPEQRPRIENLPMPPPHLLRSALYTPGSNPKALAKLARCAADVLILDLEDAVAPDSKATARAAVAQALPALRAAGRTVVVRVNGIGSPWCESDVAALAPLGPSALLFPKVDTSEAIQHAAVMLGFHHAPLATELWCMIETPAAVLNAAELARASSGIHSRMTTWVLGTNDLAKELRARPSQDRAEIAPLMSMVIAAARAHGLRILDGVHNELDDIAVFEATCQQGRAMGFDGRTLIHPSQIEACHLAYSPSAHEVDAARTIVEAFDLPEKIGRAHV
jgi:citrate lyase subunit beta/citryl-CoA lyase